MRLVSIFFTIALFLVALGLALSNTQTTELRFFAMGEEPLISVPLVILLLGFFLIGVTFGMLTGLPSYLRQQAELRKLRKQIKKHNETPPPSPARITEVEAIAPSVQARIEG
ncbi:MAG: LapA family protein [Burkholderiaceae bacterium]